MKKVVFLIVLLNIAFAGVNDTLDYTITNLPESTTRDSSCIIYPAADTYGSVSRVFPSHLQTAFKALWYRISSIFIQQDYVGFLNADSTVLLQFIGDTTEINIARIDTLYANTIMSGIPSYTNDELVNQDITTSTSGLVQLNYGATDWTRADNAAENSCKYQLGIVIDRDTGSDNGTVMIKGIYTTTGLTAGAAYYVGTPAGAYTATLPSSSTGVVVRKIGYALSTTQLYFNPSNDYAVYK